MNLKYSDITERLRQISPDEYENDRVRRINNTIDIVNEILELDIEKINNK